MKIKTFKILLSLVIVYLLSISNNSQICFAQIECFADVRPPTYDLYCENSEIISSANISYDLSDNDLFLQGYAQVNFEYSVSADNQNIEFTIPFISSATDVPDFEVLANDKVIYGEVFYGSNFYNYFPKDKLRQAIKNTNSSTLKENAIGTLYTIYPNESQTTVTINLNEIAGMIYDNYYTSSSVNIERRMILQINNATKTEQAFFIIGEQSDKALTSSSKFTKEKMTCMQYLERNFEINKDYYDNYNNLSIDFFISQINRILKNKSICNYNDFFFNSINMSRLNLYKFTTNVRENTKINYSMQAKLQLDNTYNPRIYYLHHTSIGKHPTKYIVKSNANAPFIINSSEPMQKYDNRYTVNLKNQDFYCELCASEHPIPIVYENSEPTSKKYTILIIIDIICGILLIISLINIAIYIIRTKRHHN